MEMNEVMLRISKDTVLDNSAVRVVTLVTLIYLPSSFVAVSLSILARGPPNDRIVDPTRYELVQLWRFEYFRLSNLSTILDIRGGFYSAQCLHPWGRVTYASEANTV